MLIKCVCARAAEDVLVIDDDNSDEDNGSDKVCGTLVSHLVFLYSSECIGEESGTTEEVYMD